MTLLKALDDRNRAMAREVFQPILDKVQELETRMITWKQALWLVGVGWTILAFLILTYPGVLREFLTSGASPLP